MLLARPDVVSAIALLVLLGWLGRLFVQSLDRLRLRAERVYHVACTLGVLTGLLTFVLSLQEDSQPDAGALLGWLVSAVITGGVSTFGWYFAVAIVAFVWEYVVTVPFRLVGGWAQRRVTREPWQYSEAEYRETARRREEADAREALRQRQQQSQREADRKRRDDARLECELFYDRNADRLQQKFPRERLQEYFQLYMTDSHPPEAVEQRATLLLEMIRQQVDGQPVEAVQFSSLSEISDHFQRQRAELEQLPYDAETRESLGIALNQQEEAAIREFLRR